MNAEHGIYPILYAFYGPDGQLSRSAMLPSWRAQRCTGFSADLAERVSSFLQRNYYHQISTQVVAQALGFEPSYFAKTFKRHAGRSLSSILRQIRLTKSIELLDNPYLSVQEIAGRTGFSDASYFIKVFRDSHGTTPTRFRALAAKPREIRVNT